MPNVLIRGSSWVGLMDNMRYHVISVTSRCCFTMSLSQVPHALSRQLPAWRKVRKQSLLPCLRVLCTSIFTELTSWYLWEHAALDLTHQYSQIFFYKQHTLSMKIHTTSMKAQGMISKRNRFIDWQLSDPHSRTDPHHRVLQSSWYPMIVYR